MKNIKHLCFILVICTSTSAWSQQHVQFEYAPNQYDCLSVSDSIQIDGLLNERDWAKIPWTSYFVDIEGKIKPNPYYQTKVKMLWDDNYFYIAAELEEKHIWATYTQRDAVIYHENVFEVFIDPNGDTHNYYELEINALGTIWDLMLTKPYRDSGTAINAWDISGLKKAIAHHGTINNGSDEDEKWVVELALPWEILKEAAPNGQKPSHLDQWRVNFSRVNWQTEFTENGYVKKTDPKTNKPYPEHHWVWSPQGKIAMHQPETWGIVNFIKQETGSQVSTTKPNTQNRIKWHLRQIYYSQHDFFSKNKTYTDSLNLLEIKADLMYANHIQLSSTGDRYSASLIVDKNKYTIREDGKISIKQLK